MSPDSNPGKSAYALILRGQEALHQYLMSFPLEPVGSVIERMDLASWRRDSEDADETTWFKAWHLGVPIFPSLEFEPDPNDLMQFKPDTARRLRAIPLLHWKGRLAVAVENPDDEETIRELRFVSTHRVVPILASPHVIREGIARCYDRSEDMAIVQILGLDPQTANIETNEREVERLAREQPVVRIVAAMIASAAQRRASDIHLRPAEHGTDILFRIDDEMVPVRRLIRALHAAVVSRIKVLANMNLAEHRRPQDGRTSFEMADGRKVDLRISVLPTVHGESVVVRLLDTRDGLLTIDQLGLNPEDRQRLEDVMARSHGMFLTTGPTGSGKSTTLCAMLQELRKQRINILTIEEPVEYFIENVQQMQVNRTVGFTFASALRNFLRHDPDVIMVGEIRDKETASIAVESALTGHLLLSTLHTNSAAASVTRLIDLGVEPFLVRASLLAVMSQRLVRVTCPYCKEPEIVDSHVRKTLDVDANEVFYAGRGCLRCEGLGVKGRQAIHELLVVTPAIQKLIVPSANVDTIHRAAVKNGMTSMTSAAVALARKGVISLAEAWRVRVD
jgi:type IV pilus assembly protein PilB